VSPEGKPPAEFVNHVQLWLGSRDYSDKTIALYKMAVERWMACAHPWDDPLWPSKSITWRKSLTDKALKTQSVFVGAAKGFVDWLIVNKHLEGQNPFDSVKFRGLASEYMHRRALTDEEVGNLLGSCDLHEVNGLRDNAILTIMLHTALRIGGVAGIDIQDVEKQGDLWVVHYEGKGQPGKTRVKVLPANVLMAIKAYLKKTDRTLQSQGPLFLSSDQKLSIHGMRKSIVRRLRRCGIDDSAVSTHSLRHTAATKAVESGNDIKAVQDLLDHANLATTDRYVHAVRQLDQAAELTIHYDTEKTHGKRKQRSRARQGSRDGREDHGAHGKDDHRPAAARAGR